MKGKHFKIVISNFDRKSFITTSIETIVTPQMGPDEFRKFLKLRIAQRKKLDKNFCFSLPGFEL